MQRPRRGISFLSVVVCRLVGAEEGDNTREEGKPCDPIFCAGWAKRFTDLQNSPWVGTLVHGDVTKIMLQGSKTWLGCSLRVTRGCYSTCLILSFPI